MITFYAWDRGLTISIGIRRRVLPKSLVPIQRRLCLNKRRSDLLNGSIRPTKCRSVAIATDLLIVEIPGRLFSHPVSGYLPDRSAAAFQLQKFDCLSSLTPDAGPDIF